MTQKPRPGLNQKGQENIPATQPSSFPTPRAHGWCLGASDSRVQATGSTKSYSVLLVRDCLAGLVTPAPVSSASISTSHSFPRFILLPPLPSWPLKLRPYKCTHTLHH